jgi:hypothetical protein
MATMLATAKQPDPITGLVLTAMAWQMNPEVPADAFTALAMIGTGGYDGRVNTKSDPYTPKTVPVTVSAVIMSGDYLQAQNITITMDAATTDWVFFDGERAWVLSDNDAQAGYTMTTWTPPTPPPAGP